MNNNWNKTVNNGIIMDNKGNYCGHVSPEGRIFNNQGVTTGRVENNKFYNNNGSYQGLQKDNGILLNNQGGIMGHKSEKTTFLSDDLDESED